MAKNKIERGLEEAIIMVQSDRLSEPVSIDDRMEQLIAKLCAERGCTREELEEQMFGKEKKSS